MEHTNDISAAESGKISFDGVEIVGLVVPLLFAIMTIVLVALAPDSAKLVSDDPKITSEQVERIEQIHKR